MPMVALVHPVYDCLIRLGQPDALMNEEEVRKSVLLQFAVSDYICICTGFSSKTFSVYVEK